MSESDQVALIWSAAVDRYEQITNRKLDDPALEHLSTVEGLLSVIDSENKQFSDFREKRRGIFTALEYALRPIELVGGIAAGAASMLYPPSTLIFASVMYLMDAAKGVSAKFNAIMELMGTLKDFTIRLNTYAEQQISTSLSHKLADILATLLEVFALARQEVKHGRLFSFGKSILLRNDDGKEAMGKLTKLIASEGSLVEAETLTEVKVANVTLTRVDFNMTELTRRVESISFAQQRSLAESQEAKLKGHKDHVKKVLQPGTSADDRYSTINRSRVPGTGDWIRNEKDFQDWINKETPILWVSGTPGAGKSYIASNIITYFKETYPQNVQHPSHVSVGYFFFKDDNPKTRSFHQALRDIAFKVAQNDAAYAKHIVSCIDSPDEIATLESSWRKLFLDFFIEQEASDSVLYIVLDALDESWSEDRQEFFGFLNDISRGTRLQLLMLGRPHIADEIEGLYEKFPPRIIHVSEINNSADIIHYVRSSIAKSVYLKRASKSLQAEIVEKLSAGAQGMFIWVDFMLTEIMKKRSEKNIRQALNSAPSGLSGMIRHVLKSFSESLKDTPEDADDLNELLAWVTCAQRPLTLSQVDNILKWKSADGSGWTWIEGFLRRQFASLFLLTREDKLTTADLQRTAAFEGNLGADEDYLLPANGFDDPDNPSDFDSNPETTEVTFNHASIGDFFRNETEGKVSIGPDCPLVGVNYHSAKVLVVTRYLEIISDEEGSAKGAISAALFSYACEALLDTLKGINIAKTFMADKQVIGLHLARLLSNEAVVKKYIGSTSPAFFTQENVDLLVTWLGDKDVQDSLPPKERDWYNSAISESNVDILQPAMKCLASEWLQGMMWTAHVICRTVCKFLNLRQGLPHPECLTIENIMEAAEWCGFEKDGEWYRRLAMTLRDLYHYNKALEVFEKALELSTTYRWLVLYGMASSHLATGDIAKAIKLGKMAAEELEKTDKTANPLWDGDMHGVYEDLGDWYSRLGDAEMGFTMYQKAFEHGNRCDACICKILDFLGEKQRYEEYISMLQGMDDKIPDKDYSRLTESILINAGTGSFPYHSRFGVAASHTDNVQFMLHAYSSAAIMARKERKPIQAANTELWLGTFCWMYGDDLQRAIRIWEHLIDTYSSGNSEDRIGAVQNASTNLVNYFLVQCAQISQDTNNNNVEAIQRYGRMIELLAMGKPLTLPYANVIGTGSEKMSIHKGFVPDSEFGLLLGNYYQVCGQQEDALKCYKAQVKESIRLLSDDDPTNDYEAYYRLSGTLAAVRDDEGAIGAWYKMNMIGLGWDVDDDDDNDDRDDDHEAKEEDTTNTRGDDKHPGTEERESAPGASTAAADKDNSEGDKLFYCNGCHKKVGIDGKAMCRYCWDTLFCETCFPLVKTKTHPVDVCSPKHDWLIIPPRPLAVRTRDKKTRSMIYEGDKWISIEELKSRLKERFGI